ncbi:MAG: hypothetical protein DWQ02_16060 [Bacteroidetes bacterium]|nr:MAG: hypothetical protein DWQ02_16060 [Bacteroidota bacterium]
MKLKTTLGILFAFICISLNAQSDFRDGFIINNKQDTIYGFLDYRGSISNAEKCIFRKDIKSENITYSPEEIKGFRFTDSKYYISRSVEIDGEARPLFLEYLLNGIVDIFYYRDEIGDHYFVDNGDGTLYELKNEEKEVVVDGTRYIQESNEYIGVLKYTFKDSYEILQKVDNISLDHRSLIKITYDYHHKVCTDGQKCIIYEKKLPKIKKKIGVFFGAKGMSLSQTREYVDKLYYLEDSEFGFEIFPTYGLFYNMDMPNINERFYLQFECAYSQTSFTTSNSFIDPVYSRTHLNDISLKMKTINSSVFLKYEFPQGKIRPTFEGGGFFNYHFQTNYQRDLEVIHAWGNTYFTNQTNVSPFKNSDYGIILGIGLNGNYVKEKELFLDFRYQRGLGMLSRLNTNTFSINIGFQIW